MVEILVVLLKCIYYVSLGNNGHDRMTIGVLTVNIEFMWRGLETGERRALASFSTCFVPTHINSMFTVNRQYKGQKKKDKGQIMICKTHT
jgi:hypothetical protein